MGPSSPHPGPGADLWRSDAGDPTVERWIRALWPSGGHAAETMTRSARRRQGAVLVRTAEGESVITHIAGTLDEVEVLVPLLHRAVAHGVPAPTIRRLAAVDDGVVVASDRLPGTHPADDDTRWLAPLIAEVGRWADVLADAPDTSVPQLYLHGSGPGFCLHETLAEHSPATRALLTAVRHSALPSTDAADGPDLVHTDLHPGNLLVDGTGRLTGIIDWEGMGRGDRHLDLVGLLFQLTVRSATPHRVCDLPAPATVLDDLSTQHFRAYWAHLALRSVDWAIRFLSAEDVDRYVAAGRAGLELPARA